MKFPAAVARIWVLGAMLLFAGSAAAQSAYPTKPVRLVVPYAPGGSTNILARIVGQKLSESWGQPVLVDNRPGGNTIIGTDAVAKAPPDGYTMLFSASPHVIIPHLMPLPFDAIKDFAPVATVNLQQFVLALNPSVPANTLQELIALAKAKPGQLNYASPGSGGIQHLAGELFNMAAGIKMQHIPYKGSGLIIPDLLGGQVQLSFQSPLVAVPHVKAGRLKAAAVTGRARLAILPQVPTFSEGGVSGVDVNNWFGILAPAGTPKAIVDKFSAEVGRILAAPDTREKLISQGVEPFISTPAQFAALLKAEMISYAKIIKTANIKIEN